MQLFAISSSRLEVKGNKEKKIEWGGAEKERRRKKKKEKKKKRKKKRKKKERKKERRKKERKKKQTKCISMRTIWPTFV